MADDEAPDSTAVRVALWRAMHVQVDAPPHVLEDEVGLRLADPDDGWRARGDMDPRGTRLFRAGVVARARFVEDLVAEQADKGVGQYVILPCSKHKRGRPSVRGTASTLVVGQDLNLRPLGYD